MKFNDLTVIRLHCGGHGLRLEYECLCDCGNTCIVPGHRLTTGHTKSCGCLKRKSRFNDLVGQKFNKLTVVEYYGKSNKHIRWKCICDCGNLHIVLGYNLKNGAVKSCGCLGRDNLNRTIHGLANTRLFHIWQNMKARCSNPKEKSYKNYGGRGISICKSWLNDNTKFFTWAMQNGYKEYLTIERIDNNKNYTPSNCTWIPQSMQTANRRVSLGVKKAREIKILLKEGVSVKELAKRYSVHYTTIGYIQRGKAYSYINI